MLGGCGVSEDEMKWCSLAECADKVRIELGGPMERHAEELPLSLQACVGETCRSWTVDANRCEYPDGRPDPAYWCVVVDGQVRLDLWPSPRASNEVPVSVTIHGTSGVKLFESSQTVTLEPFYPNGYECDKDRPCYVATVDLSSAIP